MHALLDSGVTQGATVYQAKRNLWTHLPVTPLALNARIDPDRFSYNSLLLPVTRLVLWATVSLAGCAITAPVPNLSHASHAVPTDRSGAPGSSHNAAILTYAANLRGVRYRLGGESPRHGFDCSGFVKYVYSRHGIYLPRTARDMANFLPAVPVRQRRPGDLVFFNIAGRPYSHVGIYIGSDQFIHSGSRQGGGVQISGLMGPYWLQRFARVARPLNVGFRSAK